jgi:tetratricopeptide (TPR) repeat protein
MSKKKRHSPKHDPTHRSYDSPAVPIQKPVRATTRSTISERERGLQAFNKGDFDTAIAAWISALRAKPSSAVEAALAEAYFRRACLNRQRAPDVVLADLQAARDLVPDDAQYNYHIGLAQHRMGNLKAAIAAYRDSLQHDPYSYDRPAYALCLALLEMGQDPAADPVWELLSKEQRARLIPQKDGFSEAVNHLSKGNFAAAEAPLRKVLDSHPGFAHNYLGVVAHHNGDEAKALEHWRGASLAGFDSPALRHNLAVAYIGQAVANADSPELASVVKAGLKVAPNSPVLQALQQRAEFLAGNQAAEEGDWSRALNQWQKVRQYYAKHGGRVPRELVANIANAFEHLARWSDAAEMWRDLLRRRPRRGESAWSVQYTVQLWRHIDTLYARAGHLGKSAETLRYAIKAQPDDLTLRLALVRRYIENQNWRSAKASVLRLLEIVPKHPEALMLHAQILDAGGDLDEMIEGWERVAASSDTPQGQHHNLARQRLRSLYTERGQFYRSIEDFEAATNDFEKALELAPEDMYLRAQYGSALVNLAPARARAEFEKVDLAADDTALIVIRAWHQVGDHKEAAKWLKRATANGIPRPTLLTELGAYVFSIDPVLATTYFNQAVKQLSDENSASLLTLIAVVYATHDHMTEAYGYGRQALRRDADYGPAHFNLGLWDAASGRRPAARDHFRRARQWARQNRHRDLLEGINEAINLFEEGHTPTLADILDTIDPDGEDEVTRRLMGALATDLQTDLQIDLQNGKA